ncbi:MAG: hypothetical protein V8T16_04860 [Parabacteroides merdae]
MDFVNNLSGKSVYDVMAPHHWSVYLSFHHPKAIEGNTSFSDDGFSQHKRLRIGRYWQNWSPGRLCIEAY